MQLALLAVLYPRMTFDNLINPPKMLDYTFRKIYSGFYSNNWIHTISDEL